MKPMCIGMLNGVIYRYFYILNLNLLGANHDFFRLILSLKFDGHQLKENNNNNNKKPHSIVHPCFPKYFFKK